MALETKVILQMILHQIAMAENLKQAYDMVAAAASVEGMEVLSYEELLKKMGKEIKSE
ncbi:MAG: hypothetical protein FWE33_00230 [Defluviitaleaceae bacterium]|nr:hypothetical protein [Defluviitaleaceae bacterium]